MHLDFETMVARVAWQFEFPYALAVNRDDDTGSEVDGTNGTAAARAQAGSFDTGTQLWRCGRVVSARDGREWLL